MRPFFQANRQFLVQHVTDAGELDAKIAADEHNDFIQLDHYGQFPFSALPRSYTAAVAKYGRRTLEHVRAAAVADRTLQQETDRRVSVARLDRGEALRSGARALCGRGARSVQYDHRIRRQAFRSAGSATSASMPGSWTATSFSSSSSRTRLPLSADPTDHAFEMALSAHAWLENILLADRRAHEGS